MDTSCSELSIEVMRNVPGGVDWEGGSRLLETGTVRHVQEGTSQLDRHCITEPSPFTPPPLLFAPLKTSTPKVNTVASVRNGEAVSGNAGVTKAGKLSSKGSKKHAAKTAQCKREITDKGEEKVTEPEREREREKPKRGTEPKRGKKKDEGYERGARAKKKDAESRRRREDRRTVSKGSVRAAKPKRRGKKDPTEGRTVKGDKENGKAVEAHAASKKKARLVVAGQKKDGSGDVPPKAMRSKLLPLQERSLPNQCYDSSTASTESTLMNQLLDFDVSQHPALHELPHAKQGLYISLYGCARVGMYGQALKCYACIASTFHSKTKPLN